MAFLVTLLYVGGMLNCPIPRAIVREMGLLKRQRVYVFREDDRRLVIEPLDDYLKARARTSAR